MEEKNVGEIAETELGAIPQEQSAKENFWIEIKIFEQYARAFISWDISSNYVLGTYDLVRLREGKNDYKSYSISHSHTGSVDTGHPWGSGLIASYWHGEMPYQEAGVQYVEVLATPNT